MSGLSIRWWPLIPSQLSSWRPKWVKFHLIWTQDNKGVCLVILWKTPRMKLEWVLASCRDVNQGASWEETQVFNVLNLILNNGCWLCRLKSGVCLRMCSLASQESSRWLAEEVGEPDLDSRWTYKKHEVEVYKTQWANFWIGVSPNRSTSLILSVLWTPKLTECPVKLGEVSAHSACWWIGLRARIMSPNGWELDNS